MSEQSWSVQVLKQEPEESALSLGPGLGSGQVPWFDEALGMVGNFKGKTLYNSWVANQWPVNILSNTSANRTAFHFSKGRTNRSGINKKRPSLKLETWPKPFLLHPIATISLQADTITEETARGQSLPTKWKWKQQWLSSLDSKFQFQKLAWKW